MIHFIFQNTIYWENSLFIFTDCPFCPLFFQLQILEAVTMQHIFMNNFQLCSEMNERVVQHFVHCTETHGRHVQYLKFLQTIVKAENKFIKKCQDIVMAEVSSIICITNKRKLAMLRIPTTGNVIQNIAERQRCWYYKKTVVILVVA